jgi:hypothetical protein
MVCGLLAIHKQRAKGAVKPYFEINIAFISVFFTETRPKNHDFTFVTFTGMVWRG